MTAERELTDAVSLTTPSGRLNPDAIGWARRPVVDTAEIGRRGERRRGRGRVVAFGRNKRWEYWNVMTPTHLIALTVSSIDYAAVHEVWVHERATSRQWHRTATVIPAKDVDLPPSLGGGVAIARAKDLAVTVTPDTAPVPGSAPRAWRLHAEIPGASLEITVTRPDDHDLLAVVVPWTRRLFQYTVKDVALPASGTVTLDGVTHDVPAGSWAVLDHGRGRWPYDARWNWGAGAGRLADGRTIGLQVGGQWTDGTGSTENGVLIGGALHKISDPLEWRYDLARPLEPWRIVGGGLDATFVPFYDKVSRTNLVIVSSRTHQCFGVWSGTFRGVSFDEIEGFAEDVHNRW